MLTLYSSVKTARILTKEQSLRYGCKFLMGELAVT